MTTDDLDRLRSFAEAARDDPDGLRTDWPVTNTDLFEEVATAQTVLALLDAAALGLAWNRVEAALPEGWAWRLERADHDLFHSEAGIGGTWLHGVEPTPTAALLALAEKLEAREP